MVQRKIKNSSKSQLIIVGFLLIILGVLLFSSNYLYNCFKNKNEEYLINNFFEEQQIVTNDTSIEESKVIQKDKNNNSYTIKNNYIAVLEIPKINLKKGLFDKNSKSNNVNKNIQILDESEMPNVPNSILALAGHSGNSNKSYFRKLYQINYDDEIIVYYDYIKYLYRVIDIYVEEQKGSISVNYGGNIIVLTTCAEEKDRQLVVIGKLYNKETINNK